MQTGSATNFAKTLYGKLIIYSIVNLVGAAENFLSKYNWGLLIFFHKNASRIFWLLSPDKVVLVLSQDNELLGSRWCNGHINFFLILIIIKLYQINYHRCSIQHHRTSLNALRNPDTSAICPALKMRPLFWKNWTFEIRKLWFCTDLQPFIGKASIFRRCSFC